MTITRQPKYRRNKSTGVFILSFVLLLLSVRIADAAGVRATPQFLFQDSKDKSTRVTISNPSDQNVEVWLEMKYGFHVSDDTGSIIIVNPETLGPDDHSSAQWIHAFPERFNLGPHESQVVRLVVTPPPGIMPSEYWARIIVSSKDQQRPHVKGKTGFGSSIEIITSTSLPFHYRYGSTNTGLQLIRPIETANLANSFRILTPLRRTGNGSFWGMLSCKILSSSGKIVFTNDYKLVIYKDFTFAIKIDRGLIPPGSYNLELTAKAERTDFDRSHLLHIEPITWTVPINIL